jgi:ribonuclease E
MPGDAAGNEATPATTGDPVETAEAGERESGRRRGRGRDRVRREHRAEDTAGTPTSGAAAAEGTESASAAEPTAEPVSREAAATTVAAEQLTVAPVAVPASTSTAEPFSAALPRVTSFALPVEDLLRIAESSGLQWVNSDPDKIAAAQAAMAAEPAPVHVPRERKPLVIVDEGPLVLVETRKDLATLKLPFETEAPA